MSDVGKVGTMQIPPSPRPIGRDDALLPTHAIQPVADDESDHRERDRAAHDAENFAHRHDQADSERSDQNASDEDVTPPEHVDTFA